MAKLSIKTTACHKKKQHNVQA